MNVNKEEEREELKTTVGENISRLSSLNGLTVDLYKEEVLPKIIDTLIV
jgi:vacuolar protein sorting-associated protein 35